ncbi:hypothetical protein RJ639_030821 [Escallonia herrerae]|uniref:Uncharacterized protein n=1 Tax=Escallonia herrerae TaxID=1293975 RepID=A0AA88WZA4_9ASTE|nr:hypothetical protein RJ639_030821 [Escallonia herrerae]
MEFTAKAINAANRAASSNTVINAFLAGTFIALSIRSVKQQKEIEALEAEKESLLKSNKAIKNAVWEWKQQLYAEAAEADKAVVPLSKLRAIYGEAPTLSSEVPEGGCENLEGGPKDEETEFEKQNGNEKKSVCSKKWIVCHCLYGLRVAIRDEMGMHCLSNLEDEDQLDLKSEERVARLCAAVEASNQHFKDAANRHRRLKEFAEAEGAEETGKRPASKILI